MEDVNTVNAETGSNRNTLSKTDHAKSRCSALNIWTKYSTRLSERMISSTLSVYALLLNNLSLKTGLQRRSPLLVWKAEETNFLYCKMYHSISEWDYRSGYLRRPGLPNFWKKTFCSNYYSSSKAMKSWIENSCKCSNESLPKIGRHVTKNLPVFAVFDLPL